VVAFVRRDALVAMSYRLPFVLSLLSSLFLLVIVSQVGRLVDRAPTNVDVDLRAGYFSYAVVGMAVLQLVHTALQSFAVQLREEQTTGTLEALLATPQSPAAVIVSSAVFRLLQALAGSVTLVLVALPFGLRLDLSWVGAMGALLTLVGLVALFAGLGIAVAAFTVVFKRGTALSGMISSGLALLSGVWFPVSFLPGPLQTLGHLLPFTWGVTSLRRTLLSGTVPAGELVGLLLSAAMAVPLALWLFRVSVDRARREGTLTQF
jgi:ABC-2 type transport system permease protein